MERILRRTIHVLPIETRYRLFDACKRIVRDYSRPEWVRGAVLVVMRNTLGSC